MSNSYVNSSILKLAQTKKIVDSLTSSECWVDAMGGSVGIVVDEESVEIDTDPLSLGNVRIPNAASFRLIGERSSNSVLPEVADLIGGNSHDLPDNMGSTNIYIDSSNEDIKIFRFEYELSNCYYSQESIRDEYSGYRMKGSKDAVIRIQIFASDSLPTDAARIDQNINKLTLAYQHIAAILDHIDIPCAPYESFAAAKWECDYTDMISIDGVLKWTISCFKQKLGLMIVYDPIAIPKWNQSYIKMQYWLNAKGFSYETSAILEYGAMNLFAGYTGCVTKEANELILKEAANPQYDNYECSYVRLEPETWVSREKRRKKVKEPIFQQLGQCILENGVQLTLRLKIHKTGYEIILDFPSEDHMIRFQETKLYSMTQWHCGAE